MAEDEVFLAREELLDLRHFFGRDGRGGIALILFEVALEEDAGGGADTGDEFHKICLDSEREYQYYTSIKVERLLPPRERSPIVAAPPPSGSDDGVASGAGCFKGGIPKPRETWFLSYQRLPSHDERPAVRRNQQPSPRPE